MYTLAYLTQFPSRVSTIQTKHGHTTDDTTLYSSLRPVCTAVALWTRHARLHVNSEKYQGHHVAASGQGDGR